MGGPKDCLEGSGLLNHRERRYAEVSDPFSVLQTHSENHIANDSSRLQNRYWLAPVIAAVHSLVLSSSSTAILRLVPEPWSINWRMIETSLSRSSAWS
jgi:hypothetical protein